jgi:hypothetical protein
VSDLPLVASESIPQTHGLQEPAPVGEALQTAGDYAHELLCARLDIIGRPLPQPGDKVAAVRAIMLRDSIDLAARDVSAVARSMWRNADVIAYTARTQNVRRRQIVPATPSCLRLKEAALRAGKALDGCCAEPWTRDDINSDELRPVLEKLFAPGHGDKVLEGRSSFLGAGSATVQLGQLLVALQRLESLWGSFDIWVQRPGFATCQSLIRAWEQGEADFEDYLIWLCQHEMQVHVNPKTDDFHRLMVYVAHVLLGTRTMGGRIWLPGDMSELVGVPDHELLPKLLSAAKDLLRKEESTEADRIRLQVGKTESGKAVRRYGDSLEALQDRGIEIVYDPWEMLLSSDTPIKLANWQDAAKEAEQSRPMNIVVDGIKWSQEEASYVRLHCIHGVSHAECQERLGMDDHTFNALRRRVDKRLQKRRLKAPLQEFRQELPGHLRTEDIEQETIPKKHGPVRVLMKDGVFLEA